MADKDQEPMSDERLAGIERRRAHLNISGKGDWRVEFDDDDMIIWYHADFKTNPVKIILNEIPATANEVRCAEFIVESPKDIQDLLAEVERLRAENACYKSSFERLLTELESLGFGKFSNIMNINDLKDVIAKFWTATGELR